MHSVSPPGVVASWRTGSPRGTSPAAVRFAVIRVTHDTRTGRAGPHVPQMTPRTTMEDIMRFRTLTGFTLAGATLLAACGGSGGGAADGRRHRTAGRHARTPTAATVNVRTTSLGDVLVDAQGRTLYGFTNDANGTSTCTGACARDLAAVDGRRRLDDRPRRRPRHVPHRRHRRVDAARRGAAGRSTASPATPARRRERPGQPRQVVRRARRRLAVQAGTAHRPRHRARAAAPVPTSSGY